MLIKAIEWIGSTKTDLSRFPEPVKRIVGQALFEAQRGTVHRDAKPMKGRLPDVIAIERRLKEARKHYAKNHKKST